MDSLADDVIHQLRSGTGVSSHDQLARSLGISQGRLAQILDDLQNLGYTFDVDDQKRLYISATPDRMIDTEILAGLRTRNFGRVLHCYQQIGSTNATAIELAESGAPEGTVVVAEEQTKGRGRLGREWNSAPGLGIWSSIILRPTIPTDQIPGLSLVGALAFAETVESELGLDVQLKWPNDGLVAGRKICGILIEMAAEMDGVH